MELSLDQKTPQSFFSSSSPLELFPSGRTSREESKDRWCDTLAVKVTRRQLEGLPMEMWAVFILT